MLFLFVVAALLLSACGPGGDKAANGNGNGKANGHDKTVICHKPEDGSYVELSLPQNAMKAHSKHEGDIIPAPADGCPK
jgi:hypothetical protein